MTVALIYLLIGFAILAWLLTDRTVREGLRSTDRADAVGYVAFVVIAWPLLLIPVKEGR